MHCPTPPLVASHLSGIYPPVSDGFPMARLFLVLSFVAGLVAANSDPQIWGFGQYATGGASAPKSSIYTVTNFNELRIALKNGGKPDDPKIIYISEFLEAVLGRD